ncbi:type II toxin-antitoxin system RelE/ParE family toxin [Massilia antarctica]|uniref:Type II toxin-antitoxin system RelE/ParE family toxin n=1 Tax=Massilia antarctica TaxID=2765360 RepID=A0AA49AA20_9BURK|nr:type II toxin-antitoxin system RelE/ParE family toxin [Massilia antarctica]QPI51811.1 type II toxin-antitoxin system RelE/ParE family toxin [Massilia antarctica]
MNVYWTPEAEQDRWEVFEYIAKDKVTAAVDMDNLFSQAASKLAEFPLLGHAGKIRATLEFIVHESYRIVYEINGETLWILALVSTSRQWPPAA